MRPLAWYSVVNEAKKAIWVKVSEFLRLQSANANRSLYYKVSYLVDFVLAQNRKQYSATWPKARSGDTM